MHIILSTLLLCCSLSLFGMELEKKDNDLTLTQGEVADLVCMNRHLRTERKILQERDRWVKHSTVVIAAALASCYWESPALAAPILLGAGLCIVKIFDQHIAAQYHEEQYQKPPYKPLRKRIRTFNDPHNIFPNGFDSCDNSDDEGDA